MKGEEEDNVSGEEGLNDGAREEESEQQQRHHAADADIKCHDDASGTATTTTIAGGGGSGVVSGIGTLPAVTAALAEAGIGVATKAAVLSRATASETLVSGATASGVTNSGVQAARAAASRAEGIPTSRRDPHGLRRRRRRWRRREGRDVACAKRSHVGDPAMIARECCAAFSLAAVNKAGGDDVTWVSSMDGDRFYPGRSSWGVHCLLPTLTLQVKNENTLNVLMLFLLMLDLLSCWRVLSF